MFFGPTCGAGGKRTFNVARKRGMVPTVWGAIMAIATTRGALPRLWLGAWALIGLAAAWFLYDSVIYVASRDPQPGATFLNRQLWYLTHMVIATPILVIAPIQFAAGIR